jgi:2-keto-4-pentenoate hydratase/2-oxohepta-3-ene-1,7-dioic acid hydratase in catechol pathway
MFVDIYSKKILKLMFQLFEKCNSIDGALINSSNLFDISFSCFVNGEKRQEGNTRDMIFSVSQIIYFLSTIWELMPGDLIYSGTPSGIGIVETGDKIVVGSPTLGRFTWNIF